MFGFGKSQQTPAEALNAAIEDLLKNAHILHKTVEVEPQNLGYMAASSIGMKSEAVRQATERINKALIDCAAAEPDGNIQDSQAESVVDKIDKASPFLLDVLHRLSEVHFERFSQLGMGLPTVVKKALTWNLNSTKTCNETLARLNTSEALTDRIQAVGQKLIDAQTKALNKFSGIEG